MTDMQNDVGAILDALADIKDLDEYQARSLPAGYYVSEALVDLKRLANPVTTLQPSFLTNR